MRILLLTDMPPCTNFTAGIVLNQLCSFLPEGSLACFSIINPVLDPQISASLQWIPMKQTEKPREQHWKFGWVGPAESLLTESYTAWGQIKRIVKEVVRFGRGFDADIVWAILEGQTMIRLALPVSQNLGVPLFTQIWDPPGWWMRDNHVDSFTASRLLGQYEQSLRSSSAVAA